MIRLKGSDGGGRQNHGGKSQFVFWGFFPSSSLPNGVCVGGESSAAALLSLDWLCPSHSGDV